jgi:hypothetical protein
MIVIKAEVLINVDMSHLTLELGRFPEEYWVYLTRQSVRENEMLTVL